MSDDKAVPVSAEDGRQEHADLMWVLTRIASWTNARWDQQLRYKFGDERTNAVIAWLKKAGAPEQRIAEAPDARGRTAAALRDVEREAVQAAARAVCVFCREGHGEVLPPQGGRQDYFHASAAFPTCHAARIFRAFPSHVSTPAPAREGE